MKKLVFACLFSALAASPVLAANANRPYQNCDRRVDNCGPTGDNMTDQLNAQQLGGGGGAQPAPGAMQNNGVPMQGQGGQGMTRY